SSDCEHPMNARVLLSTAVLAVAASAAIARLDARAGVQNPARDTTAKASAPANGTATIAGTVMTDEGQPHPLRRAMISLTPGVTAVPRSTVTDDNGRFVLIGVPAGTYTLSASRAGYVPAFYGAKKPGRGPGVPIAVRDGEKVAGIDVKLLRGG